MLEFQAVIILTCKTMNKLKLILDLTTRISQKRKLSWGGCRKEDIWQLLIGGLPMIGELAGKNS